ncbi:MAG: response regulator transcription factor [Tahibacter sp.]
MIQSPPASSILLVDDEPPLLTRLARILKELGHAPEQQRLATTVGEAKALAEAPGLTMALVDLGLPDGHGIDLIRWLRARDAELPILVISAWSTEEMILGALRAGATGYVLKERDDLEIAVSLRSALRGGAPIDPFIARRILALTGLPGSTAQTNAGSDVVALREALTKREFDILDLVSKGMSNKEIAETLFLSRLTVETHVKRVYGKLAVHSRTQAVHEARARGLLR